jgi:predicted RecA/RadA family phage recombinase
MANTSNQTFKRPGNTIPAVAPAGGVSFGDGVQEGQIFGVAQSDAAENEEYELLVVGTHELPKLSAQAWAVGALVYWDDGNSRCTTVASSALLIGAAAAVAANPSSVGEVRLNGTARATEPA